MTVKNADHSNALVNTGAPVPGDPKPDRRVPGRFRRRQAQRRTSDRKAGLFVWITGSWLALLVFLAVFADVLPLPSYTETIDIPNQAPGLRFPDFLGTDSIGRSVLARVIYGAQVSLGIAVAGTIVGILIGGLLGLVAAFYRGWVEAVVDTLTASLLSFPPLVLVMSLVAVLGSDAYTLTMALGIMAVPAFTRLVKANALAQVDLEFVVAARAMGGTARRIIFREIMPNTIVPVFSLAAVSMAILITVEGSLSFLGLGIPPPTPSWGGMIAAGRDSLRTDPALVMVPCFVMFMTILSCNVIGDYLRRRFDVRSSQL